MLKQSNPLLVFLEMIKFEHSIFALPFAYLGLILSAPGLPRLATFFWVTLAMVSFRTMGMGLNRLIDLEIDAQNPRTQNRALPVGKLKQPFVWKVTLSAFLIFEWSAFQLGHLCFYFSPIPVCLAFLYPWTKRFTWLSHLVLGIILGIAPYGAWLAGGGGFSWTPGFLSLGVIFWVCGFDIIYALQDETFDRSFGLYSIPARFGEEVSITLTRCLHAATILSWELAGYTAGTGAAYWIGLSLAAILLIREHWLIHRFGLAKIQEAFFSMNALVSLTVFLAVLADHLLSRNY